MVFVDSRNLGWRPFLWRWLNTRPAPAEAEALRPLFERYAAPAIAWVTEGVDGDEIVKRPLQAVPQTGLNLLAQLCGLLDATLSEATGSGVEAGSGGSGGDEVKLLEPQVWLPLALRPLALACPVALDCCISRAFPTPANTACKTAPSGPGGPLHLLLHLVHRRHPRAAARSKGARAL
jgi:hypothetical protein